MTSRKLRHALNSQHIAMSADDSTSADNSRPSFGVLGQQENKRRKVDEEMLSPAPEDRSRCASAQTCNGLKADAAFDFGYSSFTCLLSYHWSQACNIKTGLIHVWHGVHTRISGATSACGRCHRCTTPAEQRVSPAPEASGLRLALQDFRLNPCTSRDGPPNSSEVVNSKPAEQDAKLACQKVKGQKAIADFFRRSNSAAHADAPMLPGIAEENASQRVSGTLQRSPACCA